MTARRSERKEHSVTQTISRGLNVLRAFRCDPRPLSNSDLTARVHLPKASISRITTTLVELGYLQRIPSTGQFQLAPAVMRLGEAYLGSNRIRKAAIHHVQNLAIELNTSAGLAVPYQDEMIYVLWCGGSKTVTLRMSTGLSLPIALSAIGRAYLAVQPSERRKALLDRLLSEARSKATLLRDVNAAQAEYRRNGYCSAFEGVQKNTFGIATAIVLPEGEEVVSLGCGGASLHMNKAQLRKKIGPALLETANRIREEIASMHLG